VAKTWNLLYPLLLYLVFKGDDHGPVERAAIGQRVVIERIVRPRTGVTNRHIRFFSNGGNELVINGLCPLFRELQVVFKDRPYDNNRFDVK